MNARRRTPARQARQRAENPQPADVIANNPGEAPELVPIPAAQNPHQPAVQAAQPPQPPAVQVAAGALEDAVAEADRDRAGHRRDRDREIRPVRDSPPRRQRRRLAVELSDWSSSEDGEVQDAPLPRRAPRARGDPNYDAFPQVNLAPAAPPIEGGDELLLAVRAKKQNLGYWSKADPFISPGEAVILAEVRQLWASFPEVLASIIRLGGRPLSEFVVQVAQLVTKFKAVKEGLKFKINVPETTIVMVESSLELLSSFKDRFGPLSNTPSALASIIAFYSDPVFMALFGRDAATEAANQLRAFGRVNRTLGAVCFASLLKWENRAQHRKSHGQQSGGSRGRSGQSSSGGGRDRDRRDSRDGRDGGRNMRRNRM